MRKSAVCYGLALCLGIGMGVLTSSTGIAESAPPVKIDNLLRTELQVVDDIEVIVSRVEIGPGFALPKHYHPGEEFLYVLEGSATLWQKGEPDIRVGAGEVVKIPLGVVHTGITGDEAVKALVFRVHRKGEPDRIPVTD